MNMSSAVLHHDHIAAIHPSLRYETGDFAAWQKEARAKLANLLGLDRMKAADDDKFTVVYREQCDGYTDIRITFQSEEGFFMPCHLWIPDEVTKAPMVICLQGHSTGMHISMGKPKSEGDVATINGGDRDFARQIVKQGFIALALEQRCFGECGGKENFAGPNCMRASMTAILYGRTTIGERVFDIMRAIDLLPKHFPEIDTDNICCMGNSGGGTATIYVSAMDERISVAMPSCALCTFKDSIAAVDHCTCNYVPHIAEFFDMSELCGLIAPRSLVVVNGAKDYIFPHHGVKESVEQIAVYYKAANAEDRLAWVEGPEGHRFYAAPAWPVFRQMLGK